MEVCCFSAEQLTPNGAAEDTGLKTKFLANVRKYGIGHHPSKSHCSQQNKAESSIHKVRKWWFRQTTKRKMPTRLWDYGFVWVCKAKFDS
jgi:hypothetical protein